MHFPEEIDIVLCPLAEESALRCARCRRPVAPLPLAESLPNVRYYCQPCGQIAREQLRRLFPVEVRVNPANPGEILEACFRRPKR